MRSRALLQSNFQRSPRGPAQPGNRPISERLNLPHGTRWSRQSPVRAVDLLFRTEQDKPYRPYSVPELSDAVRSIWVTYGLPVFCDCNDSQVPGSSTRNNYTVCERYNDSRDTGLHDPADDIDIRLMVMCRPPVQPSQLPGRGYDPGASEAVIPIIAVWPARSGCSTRHIAPPNLGEGGDGLSKDEYLFGSRKRPGLKSYRSLQLIANFLHICKSNQGAEFNAW
jgi:hypothetical protein